MATFVLTRESRNRKIAHWSGLFALFCLPATGRLRPEFFSRNQGPGSPSAIFELKVRHEVEP